MPQLQAMILKNYNKTAMQQQKHSSINESNWQAHRTMAEKKHLFPTAFRRLTAQPEPSLQYSTYSSQIKKKACLVWRKEQLKVNELKV